MQQGVVVDWLLQSTMMKCTHICSLCHWDQIFLVTLIPVACEIVNQSDIFFFMIK